MTSTSPNERARCDVLVLEDDPVLRSSLVGALRSAGFAALEAETLEVAMRLARETGPEVVVADLKLPDGDAIPVLPTLRRIDPRLRIFVVTGYGSIDAAVRAVKSGADDFLTKPIDLDGLITMVRRAVVEGRRARNSGTRPKLASTPFVPLSAAMKRVEEQVERLRQADCSVLLLGETGTGKSVLARRIHELGSRSSGPFVDVNCAGLSREFVESELFGHERGAFTGAHTAKPGLLDAANNGSLFLDEIGDIDLQVQPKILKVLEEKRFRRMGDVKERGVDVRLLAATHHDLLAAIGAKSFRADLYYRISTVTITIPPLRERVEDVVPLTRHLLDRLGAADVEIAPDAREILLAHSWPGNLRELKNVVERALLHQEDHVLRACHLHFDARPPWTTKIKVDPLQDSSPGPQTMNDVKRDHIIRALIAENGRVEAAARRLSVPRSTLYQMLKSYGIEVSRIRKGIPESGRRDEPSEDKPKH